MRARPDRRLDGGACFAVALALASCAPDPDEALFDDALLDESSAALLPSIDCTGATVCTSSEVRPQCLAASREKSFGFDAYQYFNVPYPQAYTSVRVVARRFFAKTAGDLVVELRELPTNDATIEHAVLLSSGRVPGALLPRTNGLVTVRFDTAPVLAPSLGSTPRYLVLFKVDGESLTVGLGCTAGVSDLPDVTAGGRRLRQEGGLLSPQPWRSIASDVAIALANDTPAFGTCLTTPGATCDDGNTASGDGCSASCRVETGYGCNDLPSVCARNDDCAGHGCLNGATCVDGVNSYTCTCAPGFSGPLCATNTDECAAAPCLNGGSCTDGVNAFSCACPSDYRGDTCAIDTEWGRWSVPSERPSTYAATALTVTDSHTGLAWQRETPAATYTWTQAKSYCSSLSPDGGAPWRLPTRIELRSIVDTGRSDPSIDVDAFPATAFDWYWTASPVAGLSNEAWVVFFRYGNAYHYPTSNRYRVRCVR